MQSIPYFLHDIVTIKIYFNVAHVNFEENNILMLSTNLLSLY